MATQFGKGKSGNTGYAIGAGLAVVLGAAIFGFFFYQNFNKAPAIDKMTFCPNKVDSVTAVLIDATDEITPVQKVDIANRLDAIKEKLPKGGRIDLYALGEENKGLTRQLFSMCNPGSGQNASALTENARLMERRWKRDFSEKLDDEMKRVMSFKDQPQSPIMEAVKAVAVQSFGGTSTANADGKVLVIVSDMIQFTGSYNQYKGIGDFDQFTKGQYYQQIRTELRGVDVELIYVRRQTARNVQNPDHVRFWERFFRASGGKLAHVAPI